MKRKGQVLTLGLSKNSEKPSSGIPSGPASLCKYSGLKIKDRRVHETLLDEYFKSPRSVHRLSELKVRMARNLLQGDWVTIGVLASKSQPKTTKSGGRFMVWYLSNLQGSSAALFLFGEAYQQHWKESEGVVIAVLNPKTDCPDNGDKHDDLSFSIAKPGQLMVMGTSKDFGKCQSVRKDGQPCGNVVNLSECPYCQYHMASEFKKLSSKRPNLNNLGPTGAPRMLTVGMKQGIRQGLVQMSRAPLKAAINNSVTIMPPADIGYRAMHSAVKRRPAEKAVLSEVLKDPKMVNMLNKTRDGKKSIAAAHLKVIAGLQEQAKESGTTIDEILRRGAQPYRPATKPSEPESAPANTRAPAAPSTTSKKPSVSAQSIPKSASAIAIQHTDRPHSAPSQSGRTANEVNRRAAADGGPPSKKSKTSVLAEPARAPAAAPADSRPKTSDRSGNSKATQVKEVQSGSQPAIGSTPVQARCSDTPTTAERAAESVDAPPKRSVMLFLDDEDENDCSTAPWRPPIVRCNQILTPKAIETRMLAAVEVNKAGGLPAPDPNRVNKPSTLTVEEMVERKRKRELLEAAEKAAAQALESGVGERDDGTLELGWIGSKKAVRRSAVDAVGAVRNQRLAELFPEIAQVVGTKEGEEMLNRGSVNSHLAQQVSTLIHPSLFLVTSTPLLNLVLLLCLSFPLSISQRWSLHSLHDFLILSYLASTWGPGTRLTKSCGRPSPSVTKDSRLTISKRTRCVLHPSIIQTCTSSCRLSRQRAQKIIGSRGCRADRAEDGGDDGDAVQGVHVPGMQLPGGQDPSLCQAAALPPPHHSPGSCMSPRAHSHHLPNPRPDTCKTDALSLVPCRPVLFRRRPISRPPSIHSCRLPQVYGAVSSVPIQKGLSRIQSVLPVPTDPMNSTAAAAAAPAAGQEALLPVPAVQVPGRLRHGVPALRLRPLRRPGLEPVRDARGPRRAPAGRSPAGARARARARPPHDPHRGPLSVHAVTRRPAAGGHRCEHSHVAGPRPFASISALPCPAPRARPARIRPGWVGRGGPCPLLPAGVVASLALTFHREHCV